MRITVLQFVISMVVAGISLAHDGRSQGLLSREVTIKMERKSARSILTQLEKQADVHFVYSAEVIRPERLVSISVHKKSLDEVLDMLLTPLNISYRVAEQRLIILDMKEPAVPKKNTSSINGKIKNKAGEVLPGVTIQVKGTNNASISDEVGAFTIEAKQGDVLLFSSIGYISKEVTVGDNQSMDVVLETADYALEQVTVIGSRGKPRTDVERPVPVDVLSSREMTKTGQTELGQMIHFMAPSFNSTKYGISNVTSYVDPATLRGLGPDQTLVLINGKRRHQSAALNVNNVVGRGSVGTDLNIIPPGAIERVEILRDGAAAQYGSDAIAGIINVQLKRNAKGGTVTSHYGQTKEKDGKTYEQSVNFGLPLGQKGGFLSTTVQLHHNGPTDRSTPFTGRVYDSNKAIDDSMVAARNFNRQIAGTKYGTAKNTTGTLFYNAEIPLKNYWSLYSFGGYSYKDITAYGFFRPPSNAKRTVKNIYPNGYSPVFPATLKDISGAVGIKKNAGAGWQMDFSNTYGQNYISLFSNNTVNPSYGDASPTEFYGGALIYRQNSTNIDFSKQFTELNGVESVSLSMGGELRVENYQIKSGDDASWKRGDRVNTDIGASGREGFADVNAVNRTRRNIGIYADAESDITNNFLVSAAARFENYSDFGSNFSGKLSGRYKVTNWFSVRASVNRGFRAPSMHQLYYNSNADAQWLTINGVFDSYPIGHLRNDDRYVRNLGINKLKAETSLDFNAGLTAQVGNKLLLTIDAYQINIKDRIVISSQLDANSPALAPIFEGSGYALVQFFTNAIDTKTKGLDFVASYKERFGKDHEFDFNVALMLNETKQTGTTKRPPTLENLNAPLIDRSMLGLIEVAQPRNKVVVSASYRYKKIEGLVRATRFGDVTVLQNDEKLDQTFSGKVLTDASLTYHISDKVSWSLGANNIGNVYPDRIAIPSLTASGQTPYTRFTSQFGFTGAYYYTAVKVNF